MLHVVKNYDHLRAGLDGFTRRQMEHHLGLYTGYVGKANEIEQRLATAGRTAASATYNDYSELKRREVVALNGAYLHELYFDAMGGQPLSESSHVIEAMKTVYGSYAAWEEDFRCAATSTSGWALMTRSSIDGLLHNYVLSDNHIGLPVHQTILIAMDCWEHAYMVDYASGKQDYLTAAIRNMNWPVVEDRLEGRGLA